MAWLRVSLAMDAVDGVCAVCGKDYDKCPCPGPTQDGWEYRVRAGVLEARKTMRPGRVSGGKRRSNAERKLSG